MNITDLIQAYFDGDNATRLGQAAGIDANLAQKALATGLPLQLTALAEHAAQPEGQKQVLEAVSSLPNFGSISDVLSASDGASNLQRAGELLAPALLGNKAESILSSVTGQVGASSTGNGIQKILYMALPLLLSLLGRQGLNAGNIGSMLGNFSGSGVSGSDVAGLPQVGASAGGLPDAGLATAGLAGAGLATAAASAGNGANGLLELLKAQFSGTNADKIGAAAGFNGNAAGRAVQGALPVVLNAVVNKGQTEAGANDLLKMAAPFGNLSDASGNLNSSLLGDNAELARIEGQGRGLLGGLFGNVEEMTGRLGTALGGSGSSAARLLALLTPLVLSIVGKRAGGLGGSALSGLLGGLGTQLSGLLPAGMGGLGALLGAGTLAGGAAAATASRVPSSGPVSQTVIAEANPVVTETPVRPVTPAPAPTPVSTVTTEKRRGLPWWVWLIPLIILALLFSLCNKKPAPAPADTSASTSASTPATTAPAAGTGAFAITDPAAGATLPAGGFDLKGTGKAGDEVEVFQDGTSLGKATIGSDGTWTKSVPSPASGAHTYSVKGPDGKELGNVATTIGAADASASAANCTKDYALKSITNGQTVAEPFLFGGEGKGKGYTVTVKRGAHTVGTKDIALDSTCGWSYNSKPGKGQITYEVRPLGDSSSAALSTINLTVNN